jgi:hypothetical protein
VFHFASLGLNLDSFLTFLVVSGKSDFGIASIVASQRAISASLKQDTFDKLWNDRSDLELHIPLLPGYPGMHRHVQNATDCLGPLAVQKSERPTAVGRTRKQANQSDREYGRRREMSTPRTARANFAPGKLSAALPACFGFRRPIHNSVVNSKRATIYGASKW